MKVNPIALVMLAQGTCNLLGIVLGLTFVGVASPGMGASSASLVVQWAVTATLAVYAVVPALMWSMSSPVRIAFDGPAFRPGLPVPVVTKALRRAINMPLIFGVESFVVWMVCGASFPLFLQLKGAQDWELVSRICAAVVLVGLITSTFVHYGVEWVVRRRVLPFLLHDGQLDGLVKIRALSTWGKVFLLVMSASAMPVISLVLLHQTEWASTAAMIYVGAILVVLGMLQGAAISQSVLTPLGAVAAAFKRVEANDLTVAVPVQSADHIGRLSEGFNSMVAGLRRAEQIKNTFGVYVHPRLVDELLLGKVALGGELRTATVLFADIRGFTHMSESLTPGQVVEFLNQYLEVMVGAIADAGGTVDKFIGDGIMAAFGAPLALEDSARRAVEAALAMLERLKVFNDERSARGLSPVAIGIGIHTGEVVAGSIGSAKKMQYTLIGDTVNTAARVEELTKHYQLPLLVTEATWLELGGRVRGREVDAVTVRGRSVPTKIFEVTALLP